MDAWRLQIEFLGLDMFGCFGMTEASSRCHE